MGTRMKSLLAAALMVVCASAGAQTYNYWPGGNGNWSTTTWKNAAGTATGSWTSGAAANFGGTAGTVTVDAGATYNISGLVFTTSGYLLSGSSSSALSMSTATTITTPSGGTVTLAVPLSGTVATTIDGGGTLQLGNNGTVGSLSPSTASITIASGTTLAYARSDDLTVDRAHGGAGGIQKLGTNTLTLSGTNNYTGNTTVSGGTLTATTAGALSSGSNFDIASGAALNLAGLTVTLGNLSGSGTVSSTGGRLNVGIKAQPSTFAGTISGNVSVTKQGISTLKLTGTSTHTGDTTVGLGGLQLGDSTASGDLSNTSEVVVARNGMLTIARSDTFTFNRLISGTGALRQNGPGTLTLSGNNTYTGTTTVNGGTLKYGSATAVPTASAVTVNSGTVLDFGGQAATRSGNTTVNGTGSIELSGANVILSGGTHITPAITGNGSLKVSSGATLRLTGSFTNTGAALVMDGGTLTIDPGVQVSVGTLSQTTSSTLNMSGSTANRLTVANLNPNSGTTLAVTNWVRGTTQLMATAVNSGPARGLMNVSPLNQVTLGSNAAAATYWATSNELLPGAAGATFWDGNGSVGDGTVSGGDGTWSTNGTNWSTSDGLANSAWLGGTAVFGSPGGTVNVGGTQNIGGLSFAGGGYTLNGGTLALQQDATVSTPSATTTTIASVISGNFNLTLSGGTAVLTGNNTYSGSTTVGTGTLQLGDGTSSNGMQALAGTSGVSVGSNATLSFKVGTQTSFAKAITGAGGISKDSNFSLTLSGGNNYTGPTVVSGSQSLIAGVA